MSDLGNAATGEGAGSAPAEAQPSEQIPAAPAETPGATPDSGQGAGEKPTGDELSPKTKEEVKSRFQAKAEQIRTLQQQIADRDAVIQSFTNPAPVTPDENGLFPELVGLPVDGIGQVSFNGQWLPPEVAVQLARQQNAMKQVLQFTGQMQRESTMQQVKATHQDLIQSLEGEVSRIRTETIPGLPEKLGHLTDFVIGALVNQKAHASGEFDPMEAYNAIPEMAQVVKEQLGHFGNLQLQTQAAAEESAAVSQTGGGVAAPGSKPLHELHPNDRNKFLDEIGNRALERARGKQ